MQQRPPPSPNPAAAAGGSALAEAGYFRGVFRRDDVDVRIHPQSGGCANGTVRLLPGPALSAFAQDMRAQDMRAQGHRIGNHGCFHGTPLGEQPDGSAAVSEIAEAEALIGGLASAPRLFRAFGGHLDDRLFNAAAFRHLAGHGYAVALWTSVPRDWEDPDGWVERAVRGCRAAAWSVVVLHDLPTGAMRHLDGFLGRLRDGGAAFSQEFPHAAPPMVAGRAAPALGLLTALE